MCVCCVCSPYWICPNETFAPSLDSCKTQNCLWFCNELCCTLSLNNKLYMCVQIKLDALISIFIYEDMIFLNQSWTSKRNIWCWCGCNDLSLIICTKFTVHSSMSMAKKRTLRRSHEISCRKECRFKRVREFKSFCILHNFMSSNTNRRREEMS